VLRGGSAQEDAGVGADPGFDQHSRGGEAGVSTRLADHVVAMVRRLPPSGAPVVPGSTPVVAFGDPSSAEVATLGINPSRVEFIGHGSLMSGGRRRLATLDSLAATSLEQLSDAQIGAVMAECASYFRRNPYRVWFDPLDAILRAATGTSFCDGTACHLDLVQWATDPVWGRITDIAVRAALLGDGVPHLRSQLAQDNVRLVLLNGRQVVTQASVSGLAPLAEAGRIEVGHIRCRLFTAEAGGVRWVGWSTNLQSSWGVSAGFKAELATWVKTAVSGPTSATAHRASYGGADLDRRGHLPRGMRIAGKPNLVTTLADWLARSSAPTIGDVGAFGGRAWLYVDVDGHEVALNADTKRAAVETFVHDGALEPARAWSVVVNTRGRANKVLPNPAGDLLPGWYAYLTHPLPGPARL
jgi:hypothetical protein